MATIAAHLSLAMLEQRYRAAETVVAKSHYQAIWLLACGHEVGEVADVLAFSERWVQKLIERDNAAGPAALGDRRAGNGTAPKLLTAPALAALRERLKAPPDDGGLWTGPKVAAWLARYHRVDRVHAQRGWEALKKLHFSIQRPRPRHALAAPERARAAFKKTSPWRSPKRRPGDTPIEVWTTDEHRIGLKPVVRAIWAPVGERPSAIGHQRAEWLYVSAFVQPGTGEVVWYLSTGLDKPFFEALLANFAKTVGAGRRRRIILVLDNAGWHGPLGLTVPEGLRLVYLPPYSPELQPAEHLWPLVDEPIVNRHFETLAQLDAVIAQRCTDLRADTETIRHHTTFRWWPQNAVPN